MGKIQYMVTMEYRYNAISRFEGDNTYRSKINTISVCDNIEEAVIRGNKVLEFLEKSYELNKNYNKKERLSNKNKLVSNLGYIKTPFTFYLKIDKLIYRDIEESIKEVVNSIEKYNNNVNSSVNVL